MCTDARTLLMAVCAWLTLVLAPQASLACSVVLSAGDPSFSNSGASAQDAGDFSIYFEVRGWEKQSGLLPHEEEAAPAEHEQEDAGEDGGEGGDEAEAEQEHEHADAHEGSEESSSQRLDLYLSWTPLDRATFTLDLPWVFNAITEEEPDGRAFSSLAASATSRCWRATRGGATATGCRRHGSSGVPSARRRRARATRR